MRRAMLTRFRNVLGARLPRRVIGLGCAIWLGCALLAGGLAAQAQQTSDEEQARAQTQARLQALEEQITQYEQRIAEATRREESGLAELNDIDRRIKVRQQLVNTYSRRNRQLSRQQVENERQIRRLSGLLDTYRSTYRSFVRHAYMSGRLNYLGLLLTSGSLNQMLVRVKYLRVFTERRRDKLRQIETTALSIAERQEELSSTISANQSLLQKSQTERGKLAELKSEQARLIRQLQSRRTDLEADLERARRNAEQLEAQLRTLIAADSRRERDLVDLNPVAAAELDAWAAEFAGLKGALPWPVDGVIDEPFGTRVHPVYKTRTPNPGIEIATQAGAPVHAVHSGIVNRILNMPGYGTCVTISHGSYTTVYGNFSAVLVQQGQRVQPGTLLGRSGTEAEPKGTALFFALFSPAGAAENPAPWLRAR